MAGIISSDTAAKNVWESIIGGINHVSSDNGEVYINNILLDECYDIQYAYREMKEPIYGYRSQHFDAVLPGTVLITGQFTINYIHDGYLFSVINAEELLLSDTDISKQANLDLKEIIGEAKQAGINTSSLTNGSEYKTTLDKYNELRKQYDIRSAELSKLKAKAEILKAQSSDITGKINDTRVKSWEDRLTIDNQKRELKSSWWSSDKDGREKEADTNVAKYNTMMGMYSHNENAIPKISSDTLSSLQGIKYEQVKDMFVQYDIAKAESPTGNAASQMYGNIITSLNALNKELRREAEVLVAPGFFNTDSADALKYYDLKKNIQMEEKAAIAQYEEDKKTIDKRIADLNIEIGKINGIKESLEGLRLKLSEPLDMSFLTHTTKEGYKQINTLQAFRSDTIELSAIGRSEDHRTDIDLVIMYNGMPHKKITGLHLLGHSHFIASGDGSPIKEVYNFFARRIDSV